MPRKVTSSPSAQQIGVTRDHRSTEPQKDYRQGLNNFDNSYYQAFSQRYADIHPFMIMDGLPADDMPFRSMHELGTYTLQSPLKSDVYMHKTIALVPYQSILPNTWKLFYVNPTKGDDIPDDVYCTLDIIKHLKAEIQNTLYYLNNEQLEENSIEVLTFVVGTFIVCESILSTGSLLSALKMNFHSYVTGKFGKEFKTFDDVFDVFISAIIDSVGLSCVRNYGDNVDRISTKVDMTLQSPTYRQVSAHHILDVLRDNDFTQISTGINDDGFILPLTSNFTLSYSDGTSNTYNWGEFITILSSLFTLIDNCLPESSYLVSVERLIAYQFACVKFMSDDSIDTIYNANLFRNNFSNLMDFGDSFQYNGQPIIYDVFSNHNLEKAFSNDMFSASCLLFRYRQSLKYGDYFNSSRPSPYAVGDVNAPVVNNFVSAIDITKKISEQRFVNWSNRTGMSYEDYVEGLTGVRPTMDISEPLFVSHEKYKISGFEVENTGAAQQESGTNSVTTLLKSTRSDYLYNIGIKDPCIVIGLSHFDVKRLYTRIMDRNNLKSNRFDFFNKFYQYTGDQEIKRVELDASATLVQNFAYTTRFMQFKQQVSHAGGAFIGPLRSWAMVADADDDVPYLGIINSDFIRNTNSSFDIFFGSVSGLSLGNYFHFSVIYHNDFSEMRRAMDVAPDIL